MNSLLLVGFVSGMAGALAYVFATALLKRFK